MHIKPRLSDGSRWKVLQRLPAPTRDHLDYLEIGFHRYAMEHVHVLLVARWWSFTTYVPERSFAGMCEFRLSGSERSATFRDDFDCFSATRRRQPQPMSPEAS